MKAKIFNFSCWVKGTNPNQLKDIFNDMLEKSGFKVLSTLDYHFQPFGYTALWLLAESHCAIHTFPEEEKTYIEISSCNEEYQANFLSILQERLNIL